MMEHLRTGVIVRPHGVQGAVKIYPLTDDVNRFLRMRDAYIEAKGILTPIKVTKAKVNNDSVCVWLDGITTREQAEGLKDAYLCVDRANAVELPEGTYFVSDLLGCDVFDTIGNKLGIIDDVLETGANDVYSIKGDKNLMVPALKKLLSEVDIVNKRIVINHDVLLEVGLFED